MTETFPTALDEIEDALDVMTLLAREHGYLTCKIELGLDLAQNQEKRTLVERKARDTRVGIRATLHAALLPPADA